MQENKKSLKEEQLMMGLVSINQSKMYLSISIFLLFLSFIGCGITNDSKERRYKETKKVIFDYSTLGAPFLVFFKSQYNQKIGYIDAISLNGNLLYGSKPEGYSFEIEFKHMMLEEYLFNCEDFSLSGCFIPNDTILNEMETYGVKTFLTKYTKYNSKKKQWRISGIREWEDDLTIAYCLYTAGYYTFIDDESGSFNITKGVPKVQRVRSEVIYVGG